MRGFPGACNRCFGPYGACQAQRGALSAGFGLHSHAGQGSGVLRRRTTRAGPRGGGSGRCRSSATIRRRSACRGAWLGQLLPTALLVQRSLRCRLRRCRVRTWVVRLRTACRTRTSTHSRKHTTLAGAATRRTWPRCTRSRITSRLRRSTGLRARTRTLGKGAWLTFLVRGPATERVRVFCRRSHQRRRQVMPGDQVAANTAESSENWIVTTFIGVSQSALRWVKPQPCGCRYLRRRSCRVRRHV